jgi:lipopolysaccharide/colanic/teichoic acid biosynthesis glycosyltransferase
MINTPSLSAEDDRKRLTKWGRFIRHTSLDEFPVLFNVLKGEMSLVGPRPLPIKYLSRFNSYQLKRMSVKPGITGLAQIKGRNHLSWDERFKYDIKYVENYSFFTDIKIILNTIIVVLSGNNVKAKNQEIMPEFMGSKNKQNKL